LQLHRLTFWTRYSTEIRKELDDEPGNEIEEERPTDDDQRAVAQGMSHIIQIFFLSVDELFE